MEAEIEEIARQEAMTERLDETQEEPDDETEEIEELGGQEGGMPSETEATTHTLTKEQRERIHRYHWTTRRAKEWWEFKNTWPE